MVLEHWYRPDLHSGKKCKLQLGKVAKILILERTTLEQWCKGQTTVRQGSEDTGKTNTENGNHSAGKCKLC